MGKQAGLHLIQCMQPSAALVQIHPLVLLAQFLKSPIHKAPQVVQVSFGKVTVVVLPVSGGGIDASNAWQPGKRKGSAFLFPVKAMSMVYRGKFMEGLKNLIKTGEVLLPVGKEEKQHTVE